MLNALFGPVRRIFGWIGATEVAPDLAPGLTLDAPSTLVWEHENGVRGVLDITLAPETYLRSDYYTGDERIEVTGSHGFARVNRISARGIQEPSVVLYHDGEVRAFHALDDSLADGFEQRGARPLVALALDFWTWDRLAREGLEDAAAADLMAGAVAG